MESDWSETQRFIIPPDFQQPGPAPASVTAFDTQQELLWIGTEFGRISSFYGVDLAPYTSFRAHPRNGGPVKQFLFHDKGILSVAPTSVHFSLRRGLAQWHLQESTMIDLRCMSFLGREQARIVVAGCQTVMLKIDMEKGQVVEQVHTDHHYTMMKCSHYICAATNTGSINILDADNLKIIKTLNTNNTGINDMDARNNYLVTCGWTTRQGLPTLAGLANVYDLRAMVQLAPIPFHVGAASVQIHPRMSTTCIIASQNGQLQVIDIVNPNNVNLRQADLPNFLSSLVLAPSGDALAISDQDGIVHLWGSPTKIKFTDYSEPTEFADSQPRLEWMDVDTDLPLHKVGMPFYREQLLSAWPRNQLYEVGRPIPKIDSEILDNLEPSDVGQWALNPRKVRRNQAEHTKTLGAQGNVLTAPKFLSEKARDAETEQPEERRISEISEAMANAVLDSAKADIPIMYQKVEIKYSKFGVDDFDFEFYNKTEHSGLEIHINNSYCNSLLQLFRFTPVIRNLALKHTATNCTDESCLLCEMGFLFDMLDKAEGANCQATNFLKAFSTNAEKNNTSGVLEENSPNLPHVLMVQSASRFLLESISKDLDRRSYPHAAEFDQAFAIEGFGSMRCLHCKNETARRSTTHVNDLSYSAADTPNRGRPRIHTFSEIFNASISRETETQHRGWCNKCKRYQSLQNHLSVRTSPDVLMINAAVRSPEAKQYWSVPGWLPQRIGIILQNGKFYCFQGKDLDGHLARGHHFVKLYDLVGVVCEIGGGEHHKPHLVSLINVALSQTDPAKSEDWYLFNDFLVRNVTAEDAVKFLSTWKTPATVAYQVSTARHTVDNSWKAKLDTTLLYYDWSSNNRPPHNCRVLRAANESPKPGFLAAIDTEFVNTRPEEIDIKADGERVVVRPVRQSLARVSVLRGGGADEGLPFINDYLEVREPIVDYVTKFSGVREGDLDVRTSTHNLVPLKIAYKKLWLLLNLGCVFIGHGLLKDFRTINIRVPKAQVVDTVDLFYSKARQRKLSLRFLAWYLLHEEIQTDEHDSIEDARSALKLWHKWEALQAKGKAVEAVEEVYREGKKWGFKPPGEGQVVRKGPGGGSADLGVGSSGGGALAVPSVSVGAGRETPDLAARAESGPGTPLGKGVGRGTFGGVDSPSR